MTMTVGDSRTPLRHPRTGIIRYSNVPSRAWPGSTSPRFAAWRNAWGMTLRYRSHLLHINWRRYARPLPAGWQGNRKDPSKW